MFFTPKRFLTLFLLISLYPSTVFSQRGKLTGTDSLRLKKYYKVLYRDTALLVANDTVIPADTAIVKIKKRWYVRFYYKYMYVGEEEGNRYVTRKEQPSYEGKTVGNIQITRLEPFGTDIDDTSRILKDWIINAGNTIHVITNKKIIKKNLLFSEGEKLDAVTLAESERLLRTLDYIQDARIYGIPREGSDTVDILVITKDVFAIDLGFNPTDYNEIEILIRDVNMFGLGHELSNNLIFSTERKPGYEGHYSSQSVFGTYMRADMRFAYTLDSLLVGGGLNRDFVSTEKRNAGGISYYYRIMKPYDKDDDERGGRIEYGGHLADAWYGRSFLLKTKNQEFVNRTTFVISGSGALSNFTKRPPGIEDTSRLFQNNVLSLISLGLSRSNFHKEILVLRFGIREDIPIGRLFQITAGYEAGEVVNRYYAGASISHGKRFPRAGYFYNVLEVGSFVLDRKLEDGALQFKSFYYSQLIAPQGKFKSRLFLKINYIHGINRTYINDRLDFFDYNILRGIESFDVSGNNAFGADATFSMYTPWNLVGFRIAFIAFTDLSYISDYSELWIRSRPFWGLGGGLRINNENFLFGTISASIAFYPSPPSDLSPVGVILQINPNLPLPSFNPSKPQTVHYSRRDKVYYYF